MRACAAGALLSAAATGGAEEISSVLSTSGQNRAIQHFIVGTLKRHVWKLTAREVDPAYPRAVLGATAG